MDTIRLIPAFELLCLVLSFGEQADGESNSKGLRLYPDTFTIRGKQAVAANAMDGRTNIGESNVGDGLLNCASTKDSRRVQRLRYLEIDLWGRYAISAIRLHLRDGEGRRRWQTGLVVRVSNHTIDDNHGVPGKQCGSSYTATQEQSPLFSCWTSGRYIYAILQDSRYALQVCEVQIFTGMDLTGPGVASMYPKTVFQLGNVKALASKAVDGKSSIGNSGAVGVANCAVTSLFRGAPPRRLQYLRLDLGRIQLIHSIRLHLRDGGRYRSQNDMYVQISSSLQLASGHRCGLPYNSINGGQSPVFVCNKTGKIVYIILENKTMPIQICEVEVYADIICMKPHNPGNGKYYVTRPSVGGVLWLKCNRDFDATVNVTCGSSGNWSGPVPTCQPLSRCKYTDPVNGQATPIRNHEGVLTSVLYSCNRGYELTDSRTRLRQCHQNGQLSGSVSVCRIVDCGPPLQLQHGSTEGSVSTYGSAVTYNCNRRYRMVGEDKKRTVCQANGRWKPSEPPSCEEILCSDLSMTRLANGHVAVDGRRVNSTITYSCSNGYQLIGDTTRHCFQTGSWTGNEPMCRDICTSMKCSPLRECRDVGNGSYGCVCYEASRCPLDFSPVCGTDSVTYSNACFMKILACQRGTHDVAVAAQSECRYGGICGGDQPAPPRGTNCNAPSFRYWFNATSGKCKSYVSGKCFAGRNSFLTVKECQQTCVETDVCQLPFDRGLCNSSNESRWFFNSSSDGCEEFRYGGCFGNENNFKNKEICSKTCISVHSTFECLPIVIRRVVHMYQVINHDAFVLHCKPENKQQNSAKPLFYCVSPQ